MLRLVGALAALFAAPASAQEAPEIVVPSIASGPPRPITLPDLLGKREVASLTISPDGKRYAVLVYQGEVSTNRYRSNWFVGRVAGGSLVSIARGGTLGPRVMPTGHAVGEIAGSPAHWSRDGAWIVFRREGEGGAQLWRARADGGATEQLTTEAGDIHDFAWTEDGKALVYTVGPPRSALSVEAARKRASGYHFDSDLWTFNDLLLPRLTAPEPTEPGIRRVAVEGGGERQGDGAAGATDEFALSAAGTLERIAAMPPASVTRARAMNAKAAPNGDWAWLEADSESPGAMRLVAERGSVREPCGAPACRGSIRDLWWLARGADILFRRAEGIGGSESAFYVWTPGTGAIRQVLRSEDALALCAMGAGARLVCVREAAGRPPEIATVDVRAGAVVTAGVLNPEFAAIRLGRIERFEWETPRFDWNAPGGALAGIYPARAYGYILYPPDFDPTRKYPLFIDPYLASGFDPLGNEHPVHLYAASGMVVLRLAFPLPERTLADGRYVGMKDLYSQRLGFPHLSMLMGSTLAALDHIISRGFVDPARVGIGGVSHGSFVPLYMMQKHDRIAAISISSPEWGELQYYNATSRGETGIAAFQRAEDEWFPDPDGPHAALLRDIDIADHIKTIEAPILVQMSAHESFALIRLLKRMREARLPYDAFVFDGETHIKWQIAHLAAIQARNLDWFRYWLQNGRDPDPAKRAQYARWDALRARQCHNPRSLLGSCP